ncbi:MAG: DUF721 domain-containing protein [Myxococcota bacterium]|nr:DUF721 domain-containing protein [Myxococcota bacterium]
MSAARRRRSQPVLIGQLVPRVLDELGIGGSARIVRVVECWKDAVGAEVAEHCRPICFREGDVLEAEVDSSVWCQQLKLQSPKLLEALRQALGEEAPRDLRFRVGSGV